LHENSSSQNKQPLHRCDVYKPVITSLTLFPPRIPHLVHQQKKELQPATIAVIEQPKLLLSLATLVLLVITKVEVGHVTNLVLLIFFKR